MFLPPNAQTSGQLWLLMAARNFRTTAVDVDDALGLLAP
jgi:hypothetical protein